MGESHLDLIARIHAGFDAQVRLAGSLDGRTVLVRGTSPAERSGLIDDLATCGARTVVSAHEAEALIAGTAATAEDVREAAALRLTILRSTDVTLIAATRRRLAERSDQAYRDAADRALADARRLVAQRERRAITTAVEQVGGGGMRTRGPADGSA